jgi:hypothetical protein
MEKNKQQTNGTKNGPSIAIIKALLEIQNNVGGHSAKCLCQSLPPINILRALHLAPKISQYATRLYGSTHRVQQLNKRCV